MTEANNRRIGAAADGKASVVGSAFDGIVGANDSDGGCFGVSSVTLRDVLWILYRVGA